MNLIFFFPADSELSAVSVEGTPPPVGTTVAFVNTPLRVPNERNYEKHGRTWTVSGLWYVVTNHDAAAAIRGDSAPTTARCEVHLLPANDPT